MNKELEKLINPPWLESIQRFQKHTQLAAREFQDSEAMRSIRKLSDSNKLTSWAIRQSELISSATAIAESSKLASLAFQQSDALDTIRKLTESSHFAALALQESEAMKSLRATAESARLSIAAFMESEQLQDLAKTSQLALIALSRSAAFDQMAQNSNLASFNALTNLTNSPFPELSTIDFFHEDGADQIVDESLLEIDLKIREEVSLLTDYDALSEKTKSILIYLYHFYFLPLFLSCLSAYMMTNAVEARKELEDLNTQAELKTFVRSSHPTFDRSALKGFRITTVSSLNFREEPNMRSNVITTLPIGTLVEVIDKSNRSWLFVEVEINGALEQGWVSRRYTTYFK